jgi:hypothetical protein
VQPSADMLGTTSRIEVQMTDGRSLSETSDVGRPADDLNRQWERLTAKFIRLAAPVVGEDAAWRLHELISKLDAVSDVSEITTLCRVSP